MNETTAPSAESNQERVTNEAERFLAFSLNGEKYGIPLLKVKEVIELTRITPIPYAPNHFKGIMNLRGQVISVIDLRLKLKMSKAEVGSLSAIIILDLSPLCLGVIVDSINCVLAAERSEIKPRPDVESLVKSDYLLGVIRSDQDLVLLLDVERTLNAEDFQTIKTQVQAA
ncbi:MAG TPA: chemotaxis protein CheW [Bdellovibrionota bacterium]|nr:chemotaxis protein CheW [Bdellovibrionota bacterium]